MNKQTKETLCSKCLHLNVCKYKDDYLNLSTVIPTGDISSIFTVNINCIHFYQKESYTYRTTTSTSDIFKEV